MIGKRPRLGVGFQGLAQYLLHGRGGETPDRAVWTATRNLPGDDPERAAAIMQATAERSARVEKPAYHLSVSLAPGERLDRAGLERVADRLLADLGMREHQALIAEHADGAQQHIHLMVNRVHPETARAWRTSHDYARIERSLRNQERELGLRIVPGRHASVPGRERYLGSRLSPQPFAARVRELGGEALQSAPSWQDLHASLARHKLSLHPGRSGRGLVVTDGRRYVAASKVVRAASRSRLEERLGDYQPASRDLQRLQRIAADLQKRGRLESMQGRYRTAIRDLGNALAEHQKTVDGLSHASRQLDRVLARAYAQPRAARERIERDLGSRGAERTLAALSRRPDRYGRLQGGSMPRNRERAEARRVLREQAPGALRQFRKAGRAEQAARGRLRQFRSNPRHPAVEAAQSARAVLVRALRRLQKIDQKIGPGERLRAQARTVVSRLGWKAVARLVPSPVFHTLRVATALVRAPGRLLDRGAER